MKCLNKIHYNILIIHIKFIRQKYEKKKLIDVWTLELAVSIAVLKCQSGGYIDPKVGNAGPSLGTF